MSTRPDHHAPDSTPRAEPASPQGSPSDRVAVEAPSPEVRAGLRLEARVAFLAIFAFALGALLWPYEEDTSAPLGDLKDSMGFDVPMEGLMTPVTLVHFWSTWCPPCITETPAIQRLAEDLGRDDRFSLLMVAVADEKSKVGDFLGSVEATFYDPDWDVAKSYGTDKLPETHLVVHGQLVESFIGATDWDDPAVRQQILAAIASLETFEITDPPAAGT
ncbi:MAG: TlpA family protein disulfide reductase [Holophagales bacterium]|nr:TlpA family protein disulfide reductase [Holophagales bacterium]